VSGQCDVPSDLQDVRSIECGYFNTAALTGSGKVVCWGSNDLGTCNVPEGLEGVVIVRCGRHFCVAITGDGKVVCWGDPENPCCTVPDDLLVKTPDHVLM
jgi:alpha-tubulin suppressor-like RCC1 family protein